MSDLNNRCEKCERDIEQLRGEVGEVIALVRGVLAQVDEVLGKVEICNRQMFADLQAQTDAGFVLSQATPESWTPNTGQYGKSRFHGHFRIATVTIIATIRG
jgi:hypothetical protein